jgi:hypothetical protein
MPFTCSFHLDPSRFVLLLRAIGAGDLVMWSNAMRQVIADRAFREMMPVSTGCDGGELDAASRRDRDHRPYMAPANAA